MPARSGGTGHKKQKGGRRRAARPRTSHASRVTPGPHHPLTIGWDRYQRVTPIPPDHPERVGLRRREVELQAASADLAKELFHPGLGAIILAHLSVHCNSASMALQMPEKVLDRLGYRGSLQVAPQDKPLEPIDVAALRRKFVRAEQLSLL